MRHFADNNSVRSCNLQHQKAKICTLTKNSYLQLQRQNEKFKIIVRLRRGMENAR